MDSDTQAQMMQSGTRPARHLHKVRPLRFGALAPGAIPDFNLDPGLVMWDQVADLAPTACVGYTAADFLTDLRGAQFSPDFSYAAAKYVAGDGPGDTGTSFHAGVESLVALGGMPLVPGDISSRTKGELYVSDWQNWSDRDKGAARGFAQNGVRNVLGNGDAFDSILSALYQTRLSVAAGTPWFPSLFNLPGDTPQPLVGRPTAPMWHSYRFKGKKTVAGQPRLIAKPWGGTWLGDQGFVNFDRATVNALMSYPGAGALTIDPHALRWVSLVAILLERFPAIPARLVPALINAQGLQPPIYAAASACLGKHVTLDPSVPEEVGCAEAVSFILRAAGHAVPPGGLPGVNALIAWMLAHGFAETSAPGPGDIVTAHAPSAANPFGAHTGVVLKYGIGSNTSSTGLFEENYTLQSWPRYFGGLGSTTRYFTPL